jgi:membrane-anchored protein YejM (alkaline phosphatase superfamily)
MNNTETSINIECHTDVITVLYELIFNVKNNKSSFSISQFCLFITGKAKWIGNEYNKLREAINISLMISAYPNIGLKRERRIVYKFHK